MQKSDPRCLCFKFLSYICFKMSAVLTLALVQISRFRNFLLAWDTLWSPFPAAEEGVRIFCSVEIRVWQYKFQLMEWIPLKFQTLAIRWKKCCFRQVAQNDSIKLRLHCHSQTKSIFIRKTISSEAPTLVCFLQTGFKPCHVFLIYISH